MTKKPPQNLEQLARRLLEEEGADFQVPSTTGEAAENLFRAFQGHLRPLLGSSGFEALLKRSLYRALQHHPALEPIRVCPDVSVPLGGLTDCVEQRPEEVVEEAFVCLVARFLTELGRVEQGREPSVFHLWPMLAESFRPEDLLLGSGEWD
jgi:hypothetical protein